MDERGHKPTFLVAAEDRGGYEAVVTLVDRLVEDEIPWARGVLEHLRVWVRPDPDTLWLSITHNKERAAKHRRARGHFQGEPGAPDAANTRRLLLDLKDQRANLPIDALVIARDLDGEPRRLKGMHQAVASGVWPFRILLAWSEPEAEAWYVAGFIPIHEAEASRLAELTRELGFDPTLAPQRLRSTDRESVKDAKRILDRLCGEHERRSACLHAPLPHLEERGREAGIAAFLAEARALILPLFGRAPERT
jgi:hypothetical protein